ncbi:dispanin subfamily A member 2b-like [Emydura macquarii macquarii]|uniref:dispanin subfamily A member 2b-like n=1 Tax=Emydura macquarii macquarii TaxID=1129001 RepID=UPI00352AC515
MDSDEQGVIIDMQPRDGKGQSDPTPPPYFYRSTYAVQSVTAEQPRDFVLWSLFNTFFCNLCCLGFLALAFSFKARDRKVVGDTNGAGSYGRTAKWLNITVLTLSLLIVVLFIILLATGIVAVSHSVSQGNQYGNGYGK